jgi:hypothetical protein
MSDLDHNGMIKVKREQGERKHKKEGKRKRAQTVTTETDTRAWNACTRSRGESRIEGEVVKRRGLF